METRYETKALRAIISKPRTFPSFKLARALTSGGAFSCTLWVAIERTGHRP